MKQLITVNRMCISEGRKKDVGMCAIEVALSRLGYTSSVGDRELSLWDSEKNLLASNISLPRSARRFINRFDNKKPVKPFRFYLEY